MKQLGNNFCSFPLRESYKVTKREEARGEANLFDAW